MSAPKQHIWQTIFPKFTLINSVNQQRNESIKQTNKHNSAQTFRFSTRSDNAKFLHQFGFVYLHPDSFLIQSKEKERETGKRVKESEKGTEKERGGRER